jgi:predicted SprT family Zn-dependent metalloprotease
MEMTQVLSLARNLMSSHGFGHLDLTLSNTKRALGRCFYRYDFAQRKHVAHRIDLSRLWMSKVSEEQVRDTVLHELAHAVVGHEAGHGPVWKAAARRLGANPKRTSDLPEDFILEIKQEISNYKAVCTNEKCSNTYFFHRLTRNWKSGAYKCAKCGGSFKVYHN